MRKITIAIDGHSSTGKSTLAKQLAKELGYAYVDTGAMYRAVALYAMRNHWISEDQLNTNEVVRHLDDVHITFSSGENGMNTTFLNGENVEADIRTMKVSQMVSRISAIPEVRQAMVAQQQRMGQDKGVVMDGRDVGTVVFPDAELKLFMTASPEIRTKRRYDELVSKGIEVSMKEVSENLMERDASDSARKEGPLKKADDAIELDNSHLSPEDQFRKVMSWVNERMD